MREGVKGGGREQVKEKSVFHLMGRKSAPNCVSGRALQERAAFTFAANRTLNMKTRTEGVLRERQR